MQICNQRGTLTFFMTTRINGLETQVFLLQQQKECVEEI